MMRASGATLSRSWRYAPCGWLFASQIDPDHDRLGQTEYLIKITAKTEELKMASVTSLHVQECTRCGSKLIVPEWDERVNAREVQYLWRCLDCRNAFVTLVAS